MSRRPTGNGHDPNVLQFRPRPKPKPPAPDFKRPLGMFVGLFLVVLAIEALLGGVGTNELTVALIFAALITGVYLLRLRGRI